MPSTASPAEINNVWASGKIDEAELITLPSGQTALVKRPGLQALMFAGKLLDLDSLTSVVDRQHVRRVKGGKGGDHDTIDAASLMKDPESLNRVLKLADTLVPQIVVEPIVALHWTTDENGVDHDIPQEQRDPSVIYTDRVPEEDKMFLMQFGMGGVRDAERFREESQAALGSVAPLEGVQVQAKRPRARAKRK